MKVLGIDPGSLKMGWGLLESNGRKTTYISSGTLKFSSKLLFLDRLTLIKKEVELLISKTKPDVVSLESLIYVKSPTALIKLAQTRGVIISCLLPKYDGKIFEYSPNLIKSSTVGHGHASKESVQKFIKLLTGVREFETDDESDALAIGICHILNRGNANKGKSKSRSLSSSLAHKIREKR